jgi:hypothetical protein
MYLSGVPTLTYSTAVEGQLRSKSCWLGDWARPIAKLHPLLLWPEVPDGSSNHHTHEICLRHQSQSLSGWILESSQAPCACNAASNKHATASVISDARRSEHSLRIYSTMDVPAQFQCSDICTSRRSCSYQRRSLRFAASMDLLRQYEYNSGCEGSVRRREPQQSLIRRSSDIWSTIQESATLDDGAATSASTATTLTCPSPPFASPRLLAPEQRDILASP